MQRRLRAALLLAALAIPGLAAEAVTLLDKPVTVTVTVPKTGRAAQALLLQLDRVVVPRDAAVSFNIFAELPGADAKTSVDHPNFVAYVTMPANPNAPGGPAKGITLQVAEPVARQIAGMARARMTFVPAEKIPGPGVRIGAVRLEAVAK